MQILNKKDGQKLSKIFNNHLDIYSEANEEVMTKFIKYLKRNSINCIVTNKEKITFTFGHRVEKYTGLELKYQLKEYANANYFQSGRLSCLKIAHNKYINGVYYFDTLGIEEPNGCILFFYPKSKSKEALDLVLLIK